MKEWIIPLVIAVVWILNAILRSRENDEPVRTARGKAADRPGGRNATSEIDRFLQEIERMKKSAAERSPEPAAPNRAPLPKARPTAPQPPRVRPITPRVRVKVVPAEAAPPPIVLAPPVAPLTMRTPTLTPPSTRARRLTPAMASALALLRTPKSAASAVLLNEVLGPPKCRRQ